MREYIKIIDEATLSDNKKIFDMLKDNIAVKFYTFYEYHQNRTSDFSKPLMLEYNPDEIYDIQEHLAIYTKLILKIFKKPTQYQIKDMLREMIEYYKE